MPRRDTTRPPALRRIVIATLPALLTLLAPAAALAAPTAAFANGTLTVTGEAVDETLTIVQAGTHVQIVGPVGMNDPDGTGINCAAFASGSVASCVDAVVERVVVNGGGGSDTLQDSRAVTPDGDTLAGGAGDDTLTGPVGAVSALVLIGGEGADRLTRNTVASNAVLLLAGAGDDVIDAGAGSLGPRDDGGQGDDTLHGSSRLADVLLASPGADTLNGGTRTPDPGEVVGDPATYQLRNAADTVVYGPGVVQPVVVSLDGQANDGRASEGANVMADVERVEGGSGDDQLTAGPHPVSLLGGAGDDRLSGGDGADQLLGAAGSDRLEGGGGDDQLDDGDETPAVHDPAQPLPAAGDDRLDGGPGNDNLSSDRGADELIGGVGFDSASFYRPIPRAPGAPGPSPDAPFEISLDDRADDGQRGAGEGDNVHAGIEEIATGAGDDLLVGSVGPDVIYSGQGNDRIDPGAGADRVEAGPGDDGVSAVDRTTDQIHCQGDTDRADVDLPGAQPERADVVVDCETVTGVPFGPLDPRGGADTTPPAIANLRATRRRFAAGQRNTPRAAATVKRGTTFKFALSENARVTITIARKLAGRRRGGRCVVRARSGLRCTRLVTAATLVRANSSAGRNRVAYSGRVGGRALRPGRYRATVRAVDRAGNRATPRSLELTVVKPRG